MPLEGPSAGFEPVLTYLVLRTVSCLSKRSWIRLKIRLVSVLRLRPDHQASTTPLCPPKICMPANTPDWRMVLVRSSIPRASAHQMSRPPDFQFGRRRQARHLSCMTMPRPTDELASENPLTS